MWTPLTVSLLWVLAAVLLPLMHAFKRDAGAERASAPLAAPSAVG